TQTNSKPGVRRRFVPDWCRGPLGQTDSDFLAGAGGHAAVYCDRRTGGDPGCPAAVAASYSGTGDGRNADVAQLRIFDSGAAAIWAWKVPGLVRHDHLRGAAVDTVDHSGPATS